MYEPLMGTTNSFGPRLKTSYSLKCLVTNVSVIGCGCGVCTLPTMEATSEGRAGVSSVATDDDGLVRVHSGRLLSDRMGSVLKS